MNTHCASLRDDLVAYRDRELPLARRLAVRWHLAHCAACREEVAIMEQISTELQQAEAAARPEFGPALRSRILSSVAEAGSDAAKAGPVLPGKPAAPPSHPARRDEGWRYWLQRSSLALTGVALVAFFILTVTGKKISNTFNSAANSMSDSVSVSSGATSIDTTVEQSPMAGAVSSGSNGVTLRSGPPSATTGTLEYPLIIPRSDSTATNSSTPTMDSLRRVHREASITVTVPHLEEQSDQAVSLIKNASGYVTHNTLSTGEAGNKTATMEVKVPVKQFDSILGALAKLGEVKAKNVTGEDVTEEYSDAQQADQVLTNDLAIKEAQLKQDMTQQARRKITDDELWQHRAETRQLRIQVAQAHARLDLLRKMSDLANISIQLEEKPRSAREGGFLSDLNGTGRSAVDSFLMAVRIPLTALIWILAYAPLWLPALLIWRVINRINGNRGL